MPYLPSRSAVDVEFPVRNPQFALAVETLGGEGLVQLDEVDVPDGHIHLGEDLPSRWNRTDTHHAGVDTCDAPCPYPGQDVEVVLAGVLGAGHQQARRSVRQW